MINRNLLSAENAYLNPDKDLVGYSSYFKQRCLEEEEEHQEQRCATGKDDFGKLQVSLVPTQIIKDIAEVRMYGNQKYGSSDSWKSVNIERYVDALLRHTLEFVNDINSVDSESGIYHYKHMACNLAFICEKLGEKQ